MTTAERGATRFARVRGRLEAFEPRPGWRAWLYEFLLFGFKQGWACLFGGLLLALLLGTHLFYPADAPLARYDFLVVGAVLIQVAMLAFRLESLEEARVILLFHVVGTIMEIFKTAHGSWLYPEANLLRIGGVPLFSGFMYAAVGSYIARIWRIFRFRFDRYPPHWTTWLLVALFIWGAENLGTFSRAWMYPGQEDGWEMVSPAKLGAWYLLMIISFVLVSLIHREEPHAGR